MDALLGHVKAGIAAAKAEFPGIVSLPVDTWGVDYVLLRGDEEVQPVYAYRDNQTEEAIEKVRELVPFSELYAKTGRQFQPFNSTYQLCADIHTFVSSEWSGLACREEIHLSVRTEVTHRRGKSNHDSKLA